MITLRRPSTCLALLMGWGLGAQGTELPRCPQGPISFGLYENGVLYDAKTQRGIDKDFALELERRSKCRFALELKPRARIWQELEFGALMSTGSGIQNPTRERFAWDVRYLAIKNVVVVREGVVAQTPAEFLALPDLKWGAVRAFRHGDAADEFLGQLRSTNRVLAEADTDKLFKLLANGQVSAVFANETAVEAYIREYRLQSQVRVADWFTQDKSIAHSLMLSRKHFSEAEVEKWRALVRGMRLDGSLERILRQHVGASMARQLLQFTPND